MNLIKMALSAVTGFAGNFKTYLIAGAIALVLILGAYELGKFKGKEEQKVVQAQAATTAETKGIKAHAKVEQSVQKLSDPDLDDKLSRWMRD